MNVVMVETPPARSTRPRYYGAFKRGLSSRYDRKPSPIFCSVGRQFDPRPLARPVDDLAAVDGEGADPNAYGAYTAPLAVAESLALLCDCGVIRLSLPC